MLRIGRPIGIGPIRRPIARNGEAAGERRVFGRAVAVDDGDVRIAPRRPCCTCAGETTSPPTSSCRNVSQRLDLLIHHGVEQVRCSAKASSLFRGSRLPQVGPAIQSLADKSRACRRSKAAPQISSVEASNEIGASSRKTSSGRKAREIVVLHEPHDGAMRHGSRPSDSPSSRRSVVV